MAQPLAYFAMAATWMAMTIVAYSASAAPPVRLNGNLVTGGDVDPFGIKVSADGSRVIYLADLGNDNVFRLYGVAITGGPSIALSGSLATNGDVIAAGLQLANATGRVVYRADQVVDETFEIFSVPWLGGAAVRLNGALATNGDVDSPLISPDGTRVLYRADQGADERFELYSVPIGGGIATKLNPALVTGGDVSGLFAPRFSPDGGSVIYLADQIRDDDFEVFVVPSGGGTALRLNGALVSGGDVDFNGLQYTPDGSSVVYRADQNEDETFEIFRVSVSGGEPVRLNGDLVSGGDVDGTSIVVSSDSSRLFYVADQDTDGVAELYSVATVGGTATKLNGPMTLGANVGSRIRHDPIRNNLLFTADANTDETVELFVAPAVGGSVTKLNPTLAVGGDVDANSPLFARDGSLVIYRADQELDDVQELFAVPTSGGPAVKLNDNLVEGGDVTSGSVQLSLDGSRVLYRADQTVDEVFEIFITPSHGGRPVRINSPLPPGGDVLDVGLQFSPDGSRVIYVADQGTDDVFEVYARVVRERWVSNGGDWDSPANWDQGVLPDDVMQVSIATPGIVTVTGGAINRVVNELRLGGAGSSTVLELRDDASITAINGVVLNDGSVVRGDGTLDSLTPILGTTASELRAGSGNRLRVSSPGYLNAGKVEALGTSVHPAEIEFTGLVQNEGVTGVTVGQNAVLRYGQGMSNSGSMLFTAGVNNVIGDVINEIGGRIVVAGGASVTFYDDVVQDGSLQVVSLGAFSSVAIFAGAFTGAGGATGGGDVFFLGDMRPGNSPAVVTFANNVGLGASARLEMEIGGLVPGRDYDQTRVNGLFALDGTLRIKLLDGFQPKAGQVFKILDWRQRSGLFASLDLPSLDGLVWDITRLYETGEIQIARSPLPGDFNGDGQVDALDFVTWRDGLGTRFTLDDYTLWKSHFGNGVSVGQIASVPEPMWRNGWEFVVILIGGTRGRRADLVV